MRMIKKSKLLIGGVTLAAILSGCGTTGVQAPVVERQPTTATSSTAANDGRDRDPALYTVKRGDTLLRIALEHGQNYRDLVTWNDLSNPNDIKVDQVLRVLPPNGDTGGAQTSAVVMAPAIESRPTTPAVQKKTGPRGEKRPYSDATLAELRADGDAPAAKPAPAAATAPAAVAAAPAASAAASAAQSAGDDKIGWIWPTEGKVIATFDEGKNKGVDIAGKAGQPVVAAGAG